MGKTAKAQCLMPNAFLVLAILLAAGPLMAQDRPAPSLDAMPGVGDILTAVDKATAPKPGPAGRDWSAPVKLAVAFAFLALLPSILVMMTSFTRIVIVLGFVRRALTTQNIPPTVAIIGLALFLTLFTMSPTLGQINEQALKPYLADKLSFEAAIDRGNALLKEFMIRQTRESDLALFVDMAGMGKVASAAELPSTVVIPSFAVSEFRTAFTMGALLFIPFLLIDLVIAGILLAAGMMMLPPAMISLPFKIILFVLVDGWSLLAKTLVTSFQ
jgi:flagellar biosynthetic protein FliP